ncbi:hypothetical protein IAR55_000394 [Kwoniella newhampshirensis]|uniref:Uncharacterized protein n=1 Tax=Kwoniella newhampshirensis TaxID=1651941 RepID=A0AAW0Z6H9_9TREE
MESGKLPNHDQSLREYNFPGMTSLLPDRFRDNSQNVTSLEKEYDFSPRTHPLTRQAARMANPDPTGEFMYQIPVNGMGKNSSEGGMGTLRQDQSLDLEALNERLQILGLGLSNNRLHQQHQHLYSPIRLPYAASQSHKSASDIHSRRQLSPDPAHGQTWHQYPSVTELAPGDSISMYRPTRAPSASAKSSRRGGTNVDPGEAGVPQEEDAEQYEDEADHQNPEAASYWSQDNVTYPTPRTGRQLEDELTVEPTSVWTTGDVNRGMYDMRERLLDAEVSRNQDRMAELRRQIKEAQDLATTATRLEIAEKQLRELQARLIAEQVARTQMEQEVERREDETKNYQTEWASAVRALRRARDEGKKSEEEKRRLQRCFEEARDKLWKYHEALRVREARAQGKEEGRAEAWQEAERWMGGSPPIPGVEPVQAVPGTVLHQAPTTDVITPQSLQPPTVQQFHLSQTPPSPPKAQYQTQPAPATVSPPRQIPLETIAQLMDYLAKNPGAFPQLNQLQSQRVSPPHGAPEEPGASQANHSVTLPTPAAAHQASQMQEPSEVPLPQAAVTNLQAGRYDMPNTSQPMMVPVMMPMGPQVSMGGDFLSQQPQLNSTGLHQDITAGLPQPRPNQRSPKPITRTQPLSHRTPRSQPPHMQHTAQRTQAASPGLDAPRAMQATAVSTELGPIPPKSIPQRHAAESYLVGVDFDPSLRHMTPGAPSRMIHSAAVPLTERSAGFTQPPTAARSQFDDGASALDKPLPNPMIHSGANNGLARAQTAKAPSRAGPNVTDNRFKIGRRMSLSDGLHTQSRQRPMSQIPDGDRYPIFPTKGRDHSRQSSYGSIDPAAIGLPMSRDVSAVQSPDSELRGEGRSSTHPTPQRSARTPARSRVAGALRQDQDLAQPGLEDIDEATEEEAPRGTGGRRGSVPPPMMGQGQMPPPHILQQIQQAQGQGSMQGQVPRGPPRPAPSMPNLRHRITPVMPQPLGSFGGQVFGPPRGPDAGVNKTFSEPHQARREKQGHSHHHSLSALFGGRKQQDLVARRIEQLPEPESAYQPPRIYDLFVPPGMAPAAVSGGVEDVQGPRTSALGLSGVNGGDYRSEESGTMKAPTSSRSRSNHPPSAFFPSEASPPVSPKSAPPPHSAVQPHHREPINLDTPPTDMFQRRQDGIISYGNEPSPIERIPINREPLQVPLPPPRSIAPTAYSKTVSPPEHDSRHAPNGESEREAHDFHLPPPRSIAPTAYTRTVAGSPPEQAMVSSAEAEVKAIDFAMTVPLPQSRATTWIDRRTTITSVPDVEEPRTARSTTKVTPKSKQSERKVLRKPPPIIGSHGGPVDPRNFPLPPSRAATHRGRTST